MNAMASKAEDGREDLFSLLEDLGLKEAAIMVDSDNETDTNYQAFSGTKIYYF